jgi:ABC-type bacteriocin/lantibiotic exporter with double-glycine peptidase domain
MDLVGVIAVGLLGSIATLGITSQNAGGWTAQLINLLNLQNLTFQRQIFVLGVATSLILVFKTLVSLYLTRRTIFYLSNRAAVISNTMMQKLVQLDLKKFSSFRSNDLVYAFSVGISTISMGIVAPFLAVLVDISLLLILSSVLFFTEPLLATLTLLFFGAIALVLYFNLHVRAKNLGAESASLFDDSISHLQQLIHTYRELLVRNTRQNYSRRLSVNRNRLAQILGELTFFPNLSKYALEIGLVVGAMCITSYQIIFSNSSRAIAILAIFIVASLRIGPAILRIQQSFVAIKRALGQSAPTLHILNQLEGINSEEIEVTAFRNMHDGFTPKVSVESISFSHEDMFQGRLLEDLTFEIQEGEFWAIVGKSGVGKSTLVDLMVGAIKPSSGEVKISGLDPQLAFQKWPGATAYVPQEIFLTEGTIRENVIQGYQKIEISDDLVWEALELAHLRNVVEKFPRGLDFHVGQNGQKISGGERQRLGFARALITRPKLLFLDEATSALDDETQSRITETLKQLKRSHTLIMIAHRIETLRECDKILFLNDNSWRIMSPMEFFQSRMDDTLHID